MFVICEPLLKIFMKYIVMLWTIVMDILVWLFKKVFLPLFLFLHGWGILELGLYLGVF